MDGKRRHIPASACHPFLGQKSLDNRGDRDIARRFDAYGHAVVASRIDITIQPESRILIVDDLIATGGTAAATAELINKLGCTLVGFAFIIELLELEGRAKLPDAPIQSMVTY